MEHSEIGLVTALVAGFASFISPCVLPLVPAYLSFMSGVSLGEMKNERRSGRSTGRIALTSVVFVLGFSLVFILLGASATFIGQALDRALPVLMRVAGVLFVVLGIHMTGLVKIRALAMEKRFQAGGGAGLVTAFVMGLAFAFGWTPCIGPILAAILVVAGQQDTVGHGILLLTAYSLGLGIPFILAGIFINAFYSFFSRIQNHFHKIEIVSGVVLILLGVVLLVFDRFTIAGFFNQLFPSLEVG